MLPDATILLDYMLNRYSSVLDHLVVYPEQMLKNIYLTNGVIFAQRVMNKLITKGYSREQAYDIVQPLAMQAYNNNTPFKELLLHHKIIKQKLTSQDVNSCFDLKYYFKNINYIYRKVGI
jgi:adenylosuccinate lyase